jgi:hypothetical protein
MSNNVEVNPFVGKYVHDNHGEFYVDGQIVEVVGDGISPKFYDISRLK